MLLKDKTALITGSTRNTGIGIAKLLAEQGAHIFINGRTRAAVDGAVQSLSKESRSAHFYPAPGDVSQSAGVTAVFDVIEKNTGGIDILVNNACHLGLGHSFLDTPEEFFSEVMATNIHAYYLCAQRAARMMVKAGGGSIINIGSITATRSIRDRSAYITSKGAVESMTRALAVELGPHNVRVNCVVPGYIHTERWEQLTEEERSTRRENVPLGHEAFPEDIGQAVLFFASSMSRAVTGAFLSVTGGKDIQMVPPAREV